MKPISNFVTVNGIRLHYLDWGGNGPTLLFLTGMGSSAYIYGGFAPLFADRFRVLALTRRGHGDSDYPAAGYDADTLVEDIRQFMDALHIEKASLAGHSIAGVELTHFAGTHPERVEKMIYLDALDDRRKEGSVMAQNPLRNVQIPREEPPAPRTLQEYIANERKAVPEFDEIWSEVWDEEYAHGVKMNEEGIYVDRMPEFVSGMMIDNLITGYVPKQVNVPIPILYFIGDRKRKRFDGYSEEQKSAYETFDREIRQPFLRELIAEFQGRFPQAKIIVIPGGHHYCFMAHEDLVHGEMMKFLSA